MRQSYTDQYLLEAAAIIAALDRSRIERIAEELAALRDRGGRLFVVGVGGGAGHASHAVCDFRKIAGIEAYAPSDNASELTARTNDEGWDTTYAAWLAVSRLGPDDAVLVLSVGGGDIVRNISPNLVRAVEHAKAVGARVLGIVGRDGGYTATVADACVIVPTVNPSAITPHTESFQAVIWHLLVAHPKLQRMPNKWESSVPGHRR
jgi:D-sedoheptulose 7-phosphate isomerase